MRKVGDDTQGVTIGRPNWNYIINGDFQINQRRPATASTVAGSATYGGYPIDRWRMYSGTSNTATITATPTDLSLGHFTGSPNGTGVSYPGIYATTRALRMQSSTSVVGSPSFRIETTIEDVRTLSGKQCVLSGWVYSNNANLGPYNLQLIQDFGSGGSSPVTVVNASVSNTITQTWEFFCANFTMPSVSGFTEGTNSGVTIRFYGQTSVINDFYTTNWQLTETPYYNGFHKRTFAEELELCQRYYQKSFTYSVLPTANAGQGGAYRTPVIIAGANALYGIPFYFMQEMYKTPTIVTYNPTVAASSEFYNVLTGTSSTGTSLAGQTNNKQFSLNATGAAGWAAGQFATIHWEAKGDFSD